MTTSTNYMINLVVGDTGGDGHEKTRKTTINSNITASAILKAYQKAVKIIGFDLINEVGVEYEDTSMPWKLFNKLKAAGYTKSVTPTDDKKGIWLDIDEYIGMYLWMVSLGEPKFQYSLVTEKQLATIDLGGYGFLS